MRRLGRGGTVLHLWEPLLKDLRLLAADGAFVPVPTRAEVLLLGPHDLLQGAHIGPVKRGSEKQRWRREKGR